MQNSTRHFAFTPTIWLDASDGNIDNFCLETGKSGVCSFQTNGHLEDSGVKSYTSDSVFPAQNICFKNENFMGAIMVCVCYLHWKCILLTFKECVSVCVSVCV